MIDVEEFKQNVKEIYWNATEDEQKAMNTDAFGLCMKTYNSAEDFCSEYHPCICCGNGSSPLYEKICDIYNDSNELYDPQGKYDGNWYTYSLELVMEIFEKRIDEFIKDSMVEKIGKHITVRKIDSIKDYDIKYTKYYVDGHIFNEEFHNCFYEFLDEFMIVLPSNKETMIKFIEWIEKKVNKMEE